MYINPSVIAFIVGFITGVAFIVILAIKWSRK